MYLIAAVHSAWEFKYLTSLSLSVMSFNCQPYYTSKEEAKAAGRAFGSGRAAAATTCVELVKHNRQMLQLSLFLPHVSDLTRCCGVWMLRAEPRVSLERVYSSQRCNILQISFSVFSKAFPTHFPYVNRRCSWLIKSVINGLVERIEVSSTFHFTPLLHR